MSSPFTAEHIQPYPFWYGHTTALFCTFTMPEQMFCTISGKRKKWLNHSNSDKHKFYENFIKGTMQMYCDPYYSFEVHPNIGHDNVHCHCILFFDKSLNVDEETLLSSIVYQQWMKYSKLKIDMLHKITKVIEIKSNDDYINILNYIYKDDKTHVVLFTPQLEREFRALGGRGGNSPAGTSEADNINNKNVYKSPLDF